MNAFFRPVALVLLAALPLLSSCSASTGATSEGDSEPRKLSVRVYHGESATPNVLVNVPLRFVTGAIRIASIARAFGATIEIGDRHEHGGSTVSLDEEQLEALREAILTMKPGPVIQIEEGGERVEIWID